MKESRMTADVTGMWTNPGGTTFAIVKVTLHNYSLGKRSFDAYVNVNHLIIKNEDPRRYKREELEVVE